MSSELETTPLTVTALTARIKQMLEQGFSHVEVSGEVSRLTRPASGHLYFTIKDAHAAISAVVWRSTALRLKQLPDEGGEFIFTGHLSLYEPRGSYQLVVTRIEAAGAGKLAAEFERRKRDYAERGWFDPERKKSIPSLPRHIGIVTSATAAAFEDVKKVLLTRPAWLQLSLAEAIVQGSSAPASIASAMRELVGMPSPPDLILLVRGGGSIEDLWCFNDETTVRAVVECPIPVISGIGHEIDTTLSDLAADLRAATPSNAAELCCPSRDELRSRLPRFDQLANLLGQQVRRRHRDLNHLQNRAHTASQRRADKLHNSADHTAAKLEHAAAIHLNRMRSPLRHIEKRLAPLQPGERLQQQRRRWSNSRMLLKQSIHGMIQHCSLAERESMQHLRQAQITALDKRRHRHELLEGKLAELSPATVLKRGYSLNYNQQGQLITSAGTLSKGDQIHIHFHDGSAETEVQKVKRDNP